MLSLVFAILFANAQTKFETQTLKSADGKYQYTTVSNDPLKVRTYVLKNGLTHQRLETLGLEYKFVSQYLQQKISFEELFTLLQTAIFQFSKRQMTWFRKMEKEGIKIHWVEDDCRVEDIVELFM